MRTVPCIAEPEPAIDAHPGVSEPAPYLFPESRRQQGENLMTSPQTTSSPRTTPASDHASLRIEDVRNGVRLMTIDRPSRRNALDHATYVALATAIARRRPGSSAYV